jgi:hypothetical protein
MDGGGMVREHGYRILDHRAEISEREDGNPGGEDRHRTEIRKRNGQKLG